MKTKNSLLTGVFLPAFFFVLIFSSCKKDSGDKDAIPDSEMQAAIDVTSNHAAATQPFTDTYGVVLSQFDDLATSIARIQNGRVTDLMGTLGDDCHQVTISPANILQWPKTVTWTYQNCKGSDGKTRNGKVITTFSKPFFLEGATATTTYEGFSVDAFAVSGTLKFTNQFKLVPGDTVYAVKVDLTDARLQNPATQFWSNVNGTLTYQLVKRTGSFDFLSPFTTTGTLSGENSLDFEWTAETTTPVLRAVGCLWPESGVITFHWNNDNDQASIDYGDGKCDNKAEISYKGFKKTIAL